MKRKKWIKGILFFAVFLNVNFCRMTAVNAEEHTEWADAYMKTVKALHKEDTKLKAEYSSEFTPYQAYTYDLIYFDNDDIPELVAGLDGYWVSMYTFDKNDGKVYQVIDRWGYGVMGNPGYEYLPKKNFLLNYNSDFAGAIRYIFCGKMKNHKILSRYPKEIKQMNFTDKNHNGVPDEGEETKQSYYYYGNQKISPEKYGSFIKSGKYKDLTGRMSYQKMKKALIQNRTSGKKAG